MATRYALRLLLVTSHVVNLLTKASSRTYFTYDYKAWPRVNLNTQCYFVDTNPCLHEKNKDGVLQTVPQCMLANLACPRRVSPGIDRRLPGPSVASKPTGGHVGPYDMGHIDSSPAVAVPHCGTHVWIGFSPSFNLRRDFKLFL